MVLMGDVFLYVVLFGVVVGFLWNMDKDLFVILIGVMIVGLFGLMMVSVLIWMMCIKEDVVLGLVLVLFFVVGFCL